MSLNIDMKMILSGNCFLKNLQSCEPWENIPLEVSLVLSFHLFMWQRRPRPARRTTVDRPHIQNFLRILHHQIFRDVEQTLNLLKVQSLLVSKLSS